MAKSGEARKRKRAGKSTLSRMELGQRDYDRWRDSQRLKYTDDLSVYFAHDPEFHAHKRQTMGVKPNGWMSRDQRRTNALVRRERSERKKREQKTGETSHHLNSGETDYQGRRLALPVSEKAGRDEPVPKLQAQTELYVAKRAQRARENRK